MRSRQVCGPAPSPAAPRVASEYCLSWLGAGFSTGILGRRRRRGALTIVAQRYPVAEVLLLDYGREVDRGPSADRWPYRPGAADQSRFSLDLLPRTTRAAAAGGLDCAQARSEDAFATDRTQSLAVIDRRLRSGAGRLWRRQLQRHLRPRPVLLRHAAAVAVPRSASQWCFCRRRLALQRPVVRNGRLVPALAAAAGGPGRHTRRGRSRRDRPHHRSRTLAAPTWALVELHAHAPASSNSVGSIPRALPRMRPLVGLNISGLLMIGGYSGSNMFGLGVDYATLVESLIACSAAADERGVTCCSCRMSSAATRKRCRRGRGDARTGCARAAARTSSACMATMTSTEIKHVIGLCDFFIGSRMHACISRAVASVPAVGSPTATEFAGVFDSVGVGALVIDPRQRRRWRRGLLPCPARVRRSRAPRATRGRRCPASIRCDDAAGRGHMTELTCRCRSCGCMMPARWRRRACASAAAPASYACGDARISLVDRLDEGSAAGGDRGHCGGCTTASTSVPASASRTRHRRTAPRARRADRKLGAGARGLGGSRADPALRRRGSSGGLTSAPRALSASRRWGCTAAAHRRRRVRRAGSIGRRSAASRRDPRRDRLRATRPPRPATICRPSRTRPARALRLRRQAMRRAGAAQGAGAAARARCATSAWRSGSSAPARRALQGTLDLLAQHGVDPAQVEELRYRGRGWPGSFAVRVRAARPGASSRPTPRRGASCRSTGPTVPSLSRTAPASSPTSPAATPGTASIAADEPGLSLVVVRTERGREIVRGAIEAGYVRLAPVAPRC